MPSLGPAELIIILIISSVFVLPVAAWIYLYRQGGEARDLVFWAVVILLLPVFGRSPYSCFTAHATESS